MDEEQRRIFLLERPTQKLKEKAIPVLTKGHELRIRGSRYWNRERS